MDVEASGSWNSAKFRKMLLINSIASMISTKKQSSPEIPPLPFENASRLESTSTEETEVRDGAFKDTSTEGTSTGVTPFNTRASSRGTSAEKNDTNGSGGTTIVSDGVVDDIMANHGEGGINYRSLLWWQASMLMIAETISLGILSLPKALSELGLIPGLILLICLGALASYTGFVIGQFKVLHPGVHSMGDAGRILFGRFGAELLGAGQLTFIVFIMGSHILTFSIMMNAITDHGACTIIFMVVGTIVSLIFTLPRTLKGLTWLCVASFISIITAVGTTMIGVGITKPGLVHHGHQSRNDFLDVGLWPHPNTYFHTAFLSVANIVFAYAGHVAFFSFISEFRDPRDFPKALALLQCSDVTMYLVSSVVIYYYAGTQVRSPALDSASPIVRKIAYGLAIPTIVIAGVVNGHVAVKYLFVRLLRDTKIFKSKAKTEEDASTTKDRFQEEENLLHSKGWKAWIIWIGIVTVLWWVAWAISEGVPVFSDLLGLTSALFASWFTYGLSGMFFMHTNLKRQGWRVGWKDHVKVDWRKWFLLLVNMLCVVVGATICVAGLYSGGKSIAINTTMTKPFSCADNSAH